VHHLRRNLAGALAGTGLTVEGAGGLHAAHDSASAMDGRPE
jgi:hypothetical protein